MQKVNRLHYLLMFFLITFLAACKKDNQEQVLQKEEALSTSENVLVPNTDNLSASGFKKKTGDYKTYHGPEVKMGNGHARSWINISKEDNKPLALGIEFTSKAFENLPTTEYRFDLKLHQKARAVTAFDHITLNWSPHGHPPLNIYGVEHFDMHFYKITVAEQNAITGVPTAPPPAGYLPVSYVIQGATIPQMGTHWLNPASPEFPPTSAPFTHTFIYGSNNGHIHFLEPMITRAFLVAGTSANVAFPQPIHFSPSGTYYPTWYRIWKNAENGRSYVALTNFVWR